MKTVWTALPELDASRCNQVPAPVGRSRDLTWVLLFQFCDAILECQRWFYLQLPDH